MPDTLLDRLVAQFPTAKKQTLKRMAAAGRVLVNGRPARRLDVPVGEADTVRVLDQPTHGPGAAAGGQRPSRVAVVYEDADLLVVNKPPGLLTSTVPTEKRPTLLAKVWEHVAAQDPRASVGLIHRLDRDAAGLLVFSKNNDAYHALKAQFFHHNVERVYLAVVRGKPNPPRGEIDSRLLERADGTVYSTPEHGKGQRAVTAYELVESGRGGSLLRVTLLTGRKHQIRVHLSERGWPIVGDSVYGRTTGAKGTRRRKRAKAGPGLLLVAAKLAITHPRTGERLTFEIPPPESFTAAVQGQKMSDAGR